MECEAAAPERIFWPAGKFEAKHRAAGLDRWYRLWCSEPGADQAAQSAATKAGLGRVDAVARTSSTLDAVLEEVELLEPGIATRATYVPNDPLWSVQAGHYGAINLPAAWDLVPDGGSPEVVVQVVDSGLDLGHPDFEVGRNVWVNSGEQCGNGLDDDGNGFVDDCYGYNHADFHGGGDILGDGSHGTHCTGTIGAATDNGVGVAGVAGGLGGSPGVSIMTSVNFGRTRSGGDAEALVYGADHGARVSSNSWGYTVPGEYETAVLAAIDYAVAAGVIVVVAAGNDDSSDRYYPGYYEPCVAVAALDNAGVRASFSNYGDWVDISAPGVSIYSTVLNGGYETMDGTSMACPHVSGLLALGFSKNPSLTNSEALDCLYSTATGVDSVNDAAYRGKLGAGFINALAFVQCVGGAPAPTPSPSVFEPTPSCGASCDMALSIKIYTDDYPGETTWQMSMVGADATGCPDSAASGGPLGDKRRLYEWDIGTICAGFQYSFSINDAAEDGICCGFGDGYYELKLEGSVVASGGEFEREETVVFTASSTCPETCSGRSCEYWGERGYSCSVLEGDYGCDCSGCSCEAEGTCGNTCYEQSCEYWGERGYSCADLEEDYGCDCSGCSCEAEETCGNTCYEQSCDHWVESGYTCSDLEETYGCDCSGCSCEAEGTCGNTCYEQSCEYWGERGYSCSDLEDTYDCDCSGCSC